MLAVGDHRALQAAVLALKAANRDLKSRINKATRETLAPVWKEEVESQLMGRDSMTNRMLRTYRVATGNPPRALAAQSSRPIGKRKALVPSRDFAHWEFGGDRNKVTTYDRKSRKGGTHQVTRHTARQLPARVRAGRVAYPAFAESAPRMVSLWVQLIVKTYSDAAEGKG